MQFQIAPASRFKLTIIRLATYLIILSLSPISAFGEQEKKANDPSQEKPISQQAERDALIQEIQKLAGEIGVLVSAGPMTKAIPVVRKMIDLQEKAYGSDHNDLAYSIAYLAKLLRETGNSSEARPLYERALRIWEKNREYDSDIKAIVLNDLALTLQAEGNYPEARPLHERALAIRQKIFSPDDARVGESLNNLGFLLYEIGDYDAAQPLYEQALKITEKARGPEHFDLAIMLNNMAELHKAKGNYDAARPLYERALRIAEKARGPESSFVLTFTNNLADLLWREGDYWKKQFASAPPSGDPAVAKPLKKLKGAVDESYYDEAKKLYEQALAIQEKTLGPDHPDVARSLNNLAALLNAQGDRNAARPMFERALKIWENRYGPDHILVAGALNNLAAINWRQNNMAYVCEDFLRSASIINRHMLRVVPSLSFAEQRAFLDQQTSIETSALLSACREPIGLGNAYGLLFKWKGLLIDSLRRQTNVTRLGQDPDYAPRVQRLRDLRPQIAGWYQKAGSIPVDEWKKRNDALTAEKESLEREMSRALKPGALRDALEAIDLAGFRAYLKSDEIFLDIYRHSFYGKGELIEVRYAAVMIGSKQRPLLIDIGSVDSLNSALTAWHTDVKMNRMAEASWKVLSDLVWKPIAAALPRGARRIWLSPDGELSRIPWHLMLASEAKTRGWLLCQVGSARELAILRGAKPAVVPDTPGLLLAGGIDFNAGAKQSPPSANFSSLSGTETEVKTLALLGEKRHFSVTLLTGGKADKAAVISQLPNASFAHLATHGFFYRTIEAPDPVGVIDTRSPLDKTVRVKNARNPLVESGIALAGANVRDTSTTEAKGLLTAEELVGLDLSRCELVTLSACETGLGEQVTGQGVIGLRASIVAAGARSILMSLWKVPDQATRKFMEAFYTNLWVNKLSKAESLMRAQASVRGDPSGNFKAPLNWAAWVLAGEGW